MKAGIWNPQAHEPCFLSQQNQSRSMLTLAFSTRGWIHFDTLYKLTLFPKQEWLIRGIPAFMCWTFTEVFTVKSSGVLGWRWDAREDGFAIATEVSMGHASFCFPVSRALHPVASQKLVGMSQQVWLFHLHILLLWSVQLLPSFCPVPCSSPCMEGPHGLHTRPVA